MCNFVLQHFLYPLSNIPGSPESPPRTNMANHRPPSPGKGKYFHILIDSFTVIHFSDIHCSKMGIYVCCLRNNISEMTPDHKALFSNSYLNLKLSLFPLSNVLIWNCVSHSFNNPEHKHPPNLLFQSLKYFKRN